MKKDPSKKKLKENVKANFKKIKYFLILKQNKKWSKLNETMNENWQRSKWNKTEKIKAT